MDVEEIKDKAVYVLKGALNQGAEDVITNVLVDKTRQIKFANNDIVSTKTWDSVNMHVFLALKKRIVSTSISDLSNRNMDESIRNLIKFARSLKPSVDYHGIAEGPFNYRGVAGSCDKKIAGLSTENIDYVEAAINKALNYAKRTAGVLYTTHLKDYIVSSNNIEASYERTNIEISLRAFADKNASGHGVNCATNLRDFNPGEAGKKAGEIAKQALNPVEGREGLYDIIFDPLAFANLLGHIL
ncbi:MAG: TldD/PmbA family protein, partial [Candidatus Altiarchaeota archaeon]|nr:TldD/PmbA family protein [Candidatus Altiarchaeota archaeon]